MNQPLTHSVSNLPQIRLTEQCASDSLNSIICTMTSNSEAVVIE